MRSLRSRVLRARYARECPLGARWQGLLATKFYRWQGLLATKFYRWQGLLATKFFLCFPFFLCCQVGPVRLRFARWVFVGCVAGWRAAAPKPPRAPLGARRRPATPFILHNKEQENK